jgi:histidyl-tRNA synthetase
MAKNTQKKDSTQSLLMKDLDRTGEIAFHYGFTPIASPKITDDDRSKVKQLKELDTRVGDTEERTAILRLYHDMALTAVPQPPMLYIKKPFSGSEVKKKTNYEIGGLEIVNASRASAEALIIKTAWAILEDSGYENMHVEINSIGDKESLARYERELHSYFRKNIHNLSAESRQKFKDDNFAILSSTEKEDEEFKSNAPKSISSLSEQSRIHFKEVLEFLEYLEVPYQINTSLIPNKEYASHTIFEIKGSIGKAGAETLIAEGGRYNYLARKIGYKKDVPCCGATLTYPKKVTAKKKNMDKIKPARFYLVQLGALAKFHTLGIIEQLRREHIPVYHSLIKENIGGQLASAEYLKCSHLLIIGQKEAIEKSVLVRSMDVREQETVLMTELCVHLKKILKNV